MQFLTISDIFFGIWTILLKKYKCLYLITKKFIPELLTASAPKLRPVISLNFGSFLSQELAFFFNFFAIFLHKPTIEVYFSQISEFAVILDCSINYPGPLFVYTLTFILCIQLCGPGLNSVFIEVYFKTSITITSSYEIIYHRMIKRFTDHKPTTCINYYVLQVSQSKYYYN